MGTIIKSCKCESEYQDKRYGLGQRLHNQSGKDSTSKCTICGTKKN